VHPGESKSVWIPSPQYVNVACLGGPPPNVVEFKTAEGQQAAFCEWTAGVLGKAKVTTPGSIADIVATCDVEQKSITAQVYGAQVGKRTEFSTQIKDPNCPFLSWFVHDINMLTANGATIGATLQCKEGDPTAWIKTTVTRFQ
jgi:hypothetical protein